MSSTVNATVLVRADAFEASPSLHRNGAQRKTLSVKQNWESWSGPMQNCQGHSQTGRLHGIPWLELRIFPLEGTLLVPTTAFEAVQYLS